MNEILYSDIEVTAKVVMDPHTMEKAVVAIDRLLDDRHSKTPEEAALERVAMEMKSVLSRLSEMHII